MKTEKMYEGALEGLDSRKLFASVQNDAMAKTMNPSVQLGLKDPTSNSVERSKKPSKAKSTIHSIGSRFATIAKRWKQDHPSEEFNALIHLKLGGDGKTQSMNTSSFNGAATRITIIKLF
jgi:hypothetical protein